MMRLLVFLSLVLPFALVAGCAERRTLYMKMGMTAEEYDDLFTEDPSPAARPNTTTTAAASTAAPEGKRTPPSPLPLPSTSSPPSSASLLPSFLSSSLLLPLRTKLSPYLPLASRYVYPFVPLILLSPLAPPAFRSARRALRPSKSAAGSEASDLRLALRRVRAKAAVNVRLARAEGREKLADSERRRREAEGEGRRVVKALRKVSGEMAKKMEVIEALKDAAKKGGDLKMLEGEKAGLERRLREVEGEVRRVRDGADRAVEENLRLKGELEELGATAERATEEAARFKAEASKPNEAAAELNATNALLAAEVEELTAANAALLADGTAAELNATNALLAARLDGSDAKLKDLNESNARLTNLFEEVCDGQEKAEGELRAAIDRLGEEKRAREALGLSLKEARGERDGAKRELEGVRKELKGVRVELAEAKEELGAARRDLDEAEEKRVEELRNVKSEMLGLLQREREEILKEIREKRGAS